MTVYHDEVEIEDFEYDEEDEMYYYPCPCGDRFQISKVIAEHILNVSHTIVTFSGRIRGWRGSCDLS